MKSCLMCFHLGTGASKTFVCVFYNLCVFLLLFFLHYLKSSKNDRNQLANK